MGLGGANTSFLGLVSVGEHNYLNANGIETLLSSKEYVSDVVVVVDPLP